MAERLVVNINDECADLVTKQRERGITATETTRRAFSVLRWLYQEIANGNTIVVVKKDGSMTEIRFLW